MHYLHSLTRQAASLHERLTRHLHRLHDQVRRWWDWHWTRIAEEDGYAEALTVVLLDAILLLTTSLRARYLAHDLLAVYVALLRALRRSELDPEQP